MVHAAHRHAAHRRPLVVGSHVLQRVLVAVGAQRHVEHQGVHVHDGVQTPAVIRPCAPVGVVQRRAAPRDDTVARQREVVDALLHTLLHDPAHLLVRLVPDGKVAVLGLVNAVQRLRHAVDGIVAGIGRHVPLLPLEALQLVLAFQLFAQLLVVEGHARLLLDELPGLLDLLHTVLVHQRIVELHGLGHGEQGLVDEPVLNDGRGHGAVAGLVGGNDRLVIIRHIVQHEQSGLRLTHGARIAGQTQGLHRVDIVEHRVVVHVAGDEIRDHLQRNVLHLLAEGVEDAAPHRLVVGDGLVVSGLHLFAALVGVQVVTEHAHELIDGCVGHGAVVQRTGAQRLAPQSLHAAVEPVQHRQIGLTHPAIAPAALGKRPDAAVAHDIVYQHAVVIQPHLVEIVERVLHAAPFPVPVQAGLVAVQVAQTPLAVGLAVPEIPGQLLIVRGFDLVHHALQVKLLHFLAPS